MGSFVVFGLVGWGNLQNELGVGGILPSEANLGIVQSCAGWGEFAKRTQFGRGGVVLAWLRGLGEAVRIF